MTVSEQAAIIGWIWIGIVALMFGGALAITAVFTIYGTAAGVASLVVVGAFAVFLIWAAREWKRTR